MISGILYTGAGTLAKWLLMYGVLETLHTPQLVWELVFPSAKDDLREGPPKSWTIKNPYVYTSLSSRILKYIFAGPWTLSCLSISFNASKPHSIGSL